MKLLSVWTWESLENMPLLCGFVIAARLWDRNLLAGLAALVFGMGLGVWITRTVEPKLHKTKYQVRWVSVVINFLLFLILAVVFIYYFRTDTRWLNWKTDLLGGLVAGLLLTLVQSTHWTGPKSRMILHGAAMMSAFPLIMLGLRSVIYLENWGFSLLSTVLLTVFASMIITLIDYQEMYRKST
jgi:branched-subunit amino acid transport protein